jgi:hypothetical protein
MNTRQRSGKQKIQHGRANLTEGKKENEGDEKARS